MGRNATDTGLERGLYSSVSAPDLADLRGAPERNFSPRRLSPSPKYWQHVAGAFLTGAVAALIFTGRLSVQGFLPSVEHVPGPPKAAPPLADVGLPLSLGLSPLALRNLTGEDTVLDKLIVAARHNDDTSWLDVYLSETPHVIYQVDEESDTQGAQHHTLTNKGNEAMAYLQFIIDYYDRLPDTTLFIHGHRGSWHLKDLVPLIRRLKWGALPYANLRYRNGPNDRLDWECGNRTKDKHFAALHCDYVGNYVYMQGMAPRLQKVQASASTSMNEDEWLGSIELQQAWSQVFQRELGPPPPLIHGPCCAEFVVARARILAHPKSFYVHLRDWIVETEFDRYRSGRVLENVWQVIFGEPAVLQPVEECDLLTCSPEDEKEAALPTPQHEPFSEADV